MRRMSEKRGYKQLDVSSSEAATKAADKVICSIGFGSFVRYAFVQLNVKILHLWGPTQIYIYISARYSFSANGNQKFTCYCSCIWFRLLLYYFQITTLICCLAPLASLVISRQHYTLHRY